MTQGPSRVEPIVLEGDHVRLEPMALEHLPGLVAGGGGAPPRPARLEIGWTWIAPAWQHSAVNTEAKLLMLTHAFEALGCRRVEFKTDAQNEASPAALLGIGATFEGVFRKHMLVRGGGRRDSARDSITD